MPAVVTELDQPPNSLNGVLDAAEGLIRKLDNADILAKYNAIKQKLATSQGPGGITGSQLPAVGALPAPTWQLATQPTVQHYAPPIREAESTRKAVVDASQRGESFHDRTFGMQHLDAGAGLSESMQVVRMSVENENELLRAQLDVMQQREKQQRAEFHALKNESEYRLRELELKLQDQRTLDSRKLGAEADIARAELSQAQNYNERLKATLEHSTAEDATRVARLVGLDATLSDTSKHITRMTEQVTVLQRQILPTFRLDTNAELPPENPVPAGVADEYGVYSGASKLERQIVMLKMIFDAKLETLGLIRSKLNDENLQLRSELERANSRVSFDSALPAQLDLQIQAERDKARTDLEQVKAQYEAELQRIKTWVGNFQAAAQSTNERAAQAQEQYEKLQAAYSELEAENRRLTKALASDQDARVQLAADLATERKETASLRQQLEQLKMAQKFLAAGTKKIPDAKMDLMKTINTLMDEVKRLKEDNGQLDLELQQAKRERLQTRVGSQLSTAEVEMAAREQVTDSELTAKILRRNLDSISQERAASAFTPSSMPLP